LPGTADPPQTGPEVRGLVLRLAGEDPARGYSRVRGGLARPGCQVSEATVRRVLRAGGFRSAPRDPDTSRATFLLTQAEGLLVVFVVL